MNRMSLEWHVLNKHEWRLNCWELWKTIEIWWLLWYWTSQITYAVDWFSDLVIKVLDNWYPEDLDMVSAEEIFKHLCELVRQWIPMPKLYWFLRWKVWDEVISAFLQSRLDVWIEDGFPNWHININSEFETQIRKWLFLHKNQNVVFRDWLPYITRITRR